MYNPPPAALPGAMAMNRVGRASRRVVSSWKEQRLGRSLALPRTARSAVASALTAAALLVSAANCLAADAPPLPPLTSVSGNPRLPGKFVWADLVTDDVPAARRFYGELFGWTFHDVGNYTIALNDGRPLAGLFQRARPQDKPDAHPRWFGYISVANVSKVAQSVTRAGGRVVSAPAKFPKRGEQAVFKDPEGALFGAVKSSSGDPEDFLASRGDWIWIQLLSRNAKIAADFYREVAGYDVVENTRPGRLSDYVLTSKGYARATVRTIPSGLDKLQPAWLPFVRVTNLAESMAKIGELGGRVLITPRPDLLDGHVAVAADPTGAAIGLMDWSPEPGKEGDSK